MYRAYYGVAGSGPLQPLDKYQWPFREFSSLDEALSWAGCVAARGTAVLAIDGDDGTKLSQGDIALGILRHRNVRDNPPLGKTRAPVGDEHDPGPAAA
jgi:hypothetical protein